VKTGDLVMLAPNSERLSQLRLKLGIELPNMWEFIGIIVENDISMWEEEVIPSGMKVLWKSGEMETLYSDELRLLPTCKGDLP